MTKAAPKVCPLVTRHGPDGAQLLAFRHPTAGCQLVKGGLRRGEAPRAAARRELWEESGLRPPDPPRHLVTRPFAAPPAMPPAIWHLYHLHTTGLPESWAHRTADDHGLVFRFFWHPLALAPGADWHPVYARVSQVASALLAQRLPPPGRTS